MICKYCGNTIDDGSTVCPYCGSAASQYTATASARASASAESNYDSEDDSYSSSKKSFKLPKVSAPNFSMPNLSPATILSLLCALFSLICLFRISALSRTVKENAATVSSGVSQVQSSLTSLDERLSSLDTTLANVQTEAYNQYADQAITITKDLEDLTGAVAAGRYNQMFIVKAKGNLDLNTSFDWQKFDDATQSWVSIEFTGTATTNEDYGLRIENSYDSSTSEYETILWANGITPSAAGTYRCVITDSSGITKTSSEAIVQVTTE